MAKLNLRNPINLLKAFQINGVAVTASAAEINKLASVTAGTAAASKAAVLGANKNLDTLVIADGGLKLGAAAGTAIAATAAEINAACDLSAWATEGFHPALCAVAIFDPSATTGERTAEAHALGVTIPDNAIVLGGFVDVITTFTSGDDSATIAISVQSANDIVTATAISAGGNIWDAGVHAITPKFNTPETTGIKLTAAREITATVAVQPLTAGKAAIYLFYVPGL